MGGRSPCSVRPVAAPNSDLPCPPGCPTSGRRGAERCGPGHDPGSGPGRPAAAAPRLAPVGLAGGGLRAAAAPAQPPGTMGQSPHRLSLSYPDAGSRTMSAPNKQYDPVEVASLSPGELARMRDEALAAVAAAGTLDELKAARLAHAGDRSP